MKLSDNYCFFFTGSCNVNEERPNVEISVEKQQLVAFTSYAASRPSSNQQTPLDEETKDCGKNEEGVPSSSRQSPRSISEVTHDQGKVFHTLSNQQIFCVRWLHKTPHLIGLQTDPFYRPQDHYYADFSLVFFFSIKIINQKCKQTLESDRDR